MQSRSHEEELTEAIQMYLREHPLAMDTLEGIAEWWVTRQRIRVEVTMLVRVLQRLVDRGVLEKLGTEQDPLYRLKQSNANQ